jgi:ABC-type multidrug transport system fused ATPase/permease subunit
LLHRFGPLERSVSELVSLDGKSEKSVSKSQTPRSSLVVEVGPSNSPESSVSKQIISRQMLPSEFRVVDPPVARWLLPCIIELLIFSFSYNPFTWILLLILDQVIFGWFVVLIGRKVWQFYNDSGSVQVPNVVFRFLFHYPINYFVRTTDLIPNNYFPEYYHGENTFTGGNDARSVRAQHASMLKRDEELYRIEIQSLDSMQDLWFRSFMAVYYIVYYLFIILTKYDWFNNILIAVCFTSTVTEREAKIAFCSAGLMELAWPVALSIVVIYCVYASVSTVFPRVKRNWQVDRVDHDGVNVGMQSQFLVSSILHHELMSNYFVMNTFSESTEANMVSFINKLYQVNHRISVPATAMCTVRFSLIHMKYLIQQFTRAGDNLVFRMGPSNTSSSIVSLALQAMMFDGLASKISSQ